MSIPDQLPQQGIEGIVLTSTFLFLAYVAVAARFYARHLQRKPVWVDDYLILVGLVRYDLCRVFFRSQKLRILTHLLAFPDVHYRYYCRRLSTYALSKVSFTPLSIADKIMQLFLKAVLIFILQIPQ